MQFMIDYMQKDTFNIVVLEGPMGQSAQLQRWEGINNVLAENKGVKILAYDTANWSRSEAMTLMETWLTTYGDKIDAAIKVLNGEKVEKEIWIPFQMITKDNVSEYENKY